MAANKGHLTMTLDVIIQKQKKCFPEFTLGRIYKNGKLIKSDITKILALFL